MKGDPPPTALPPPQANCLLVEFGWMRATCRYPSNVSVIETLALQKLAGVKDIWEKYPSPHPLFWTLPPSPSPPVLVTLHDKYLPYVNQKHLIFARVYFFSVLPNTYSWRCFQVYGNPSFTLRTSIKYDRSDRGLTQSLCFVVRRQGDESILSGSGRSYWVIKRRNELSINFSVDWVALPKRDESVWSNLAVLSMARLF